MEKKKEVKDTKSVKEINAIYENKKRNKKQEQTLSEKEKKKRAINLSIIIASIVVVVAGLITGLVFLLTSKTPGNPELDKFAESVNNSNQSTTDIKGQEVVLPSGAEIGDIVYVDDKYIVSSDNGVESIFIRNETEGAPTKIVTFASGSEQVSYTKVDKIVDDSAHIINEGTNKTYAVNLETKEVVVETTEYKEIEFKNGFVFLVYDTEDRLYVKLYSIESNSEIINNDFTNEIYNLFLSNDTFVIDYKSNRVIYSYEIIDNEFRVISQSEILRNEIVEDNYVPNDNESVIDIDGTNIVENK